MATHQPRYPTFVLKININCCKACPKKLKKWMEKMTGVISVGINPEKKLVYVTGTINPKDLIEKVHKKSNKKATLVEESKPNINHHDQKNRGANTNDRGGRDHNHGGNGAGDHDGHCNDCSDVDDTTDCTDDDSSSCCSRDTRNRGGDHKAEAYVPGCDHMVDEEICRDKFCLNHPRNSIIRNGLPLPYMHHHPFSRRGPMPPPFSSFRPPPPAYGLRMPPPVPLAPPYPAYGYNRSRLPFSWM